MSRFIVPLACLVVLAVQNPPNASGAEYAHARYGWTLGFNLGGGSAGLSADGSSSEREFGGTGNFRVGYAVSPSIVLALEGNAWVKEINGVTWTFGVGGPAITFFPSNEGFFVRGGVGAGSVEARVGGSSASQSGFGLLVATGYEWRVARTFAIGPQAEYSWMDVGDGLKANFFSGSVAMNWYWGAPRQ